MKNNNEDYANLLDIYAKLIRRPNYELTNKQKDMIKELGETFCKNTNIIENSKFQLVRKSREEKNRRILENENIKLAKVISSKNIGKEPGE